jgi:nucleotide-binding universal stress UspA family protein
MKFLVCYDRSTAAAEALKLAQQHAGVWNAELEVVHVRTREEPLKHSDIEKQEENLANELNGLLGDSDVSYKQRLYVTSLEAGEQLIDFAKNKRVDQIFVGITRTSKVGKLLFGSTAQYVILNAPCPVVTVHP